MKTRRENLVEAGIPVNELALVSDPVLDTKTTGSARKDLCLSFTWDQTPQKDAYWDEWDRWLDGCRVHKPVPSGCLPETWQHPDNAAVDRFAAQMKSKLARAREKGYGGWDNPKICSIEHLVDLLVGHIYKDNPGNWLDIANFAMMLHERGAATSLLPPAVIRQKQPVDGVQVRADARTLKREKDEKL